MELLDSDSDQEVDHLITMKMKRKRANKKEEDNEEKEEDEEDEEDDEALNKFAGMDQMLGWQLACLLGERHMLIDTKLSTSTHVALNSPEPRNSNGTAVFMPVLTPKRKTVTAATHVFVVGNCPTRSGGMGNNVSKLVLGCKAAGLWHGRHSGVPAHLAVLDLSTA